MSANNPDAFAARMLTLLVTLTLFFTFLAIDAHRMGTPARDVPYLVEAQARGEELHGVSLVKQREIQDWQRRYGVGHLPHIVWLWGMLAGLCGVSALLLAWG